MDGIHYFCLSFNHYSLLRFITRETMQAIPLSLYIHFPWCIQKCPYCDFNSHTLKTNTSISDYIDALIKDCDAILPQVWGRPISTIFIGGGTPSLIPPKEMEKLFSALRARFNISPFVEITLEANPGTVDQNFFKSYYDLGINRLSIGIQSFNDQYLQKLGRIHSKKQALIAIETAKNIGFERINLDLMFALPEQNTEEALQDLELAFAQEITHISHYQLTLEPNTYFHRYPPILPHDEIIEEMQISAASLFEAQGFTQYEVSAFAKNEDQRCRHNINYWQFGDYLGIGAGAHGKITLQHDQKVIRTALQKQPQAYIKNAGLTHNFDENKIVSTQELPFEFMLNILRLKEGVNSELYEQRTFLKLAELNPILQELKQQGLLIDSHHKIQASQHGFLYLNQILEHFL